MRRVFAPGLLLLLSVAAAPLFAQVYVVPPGPDSKTPIEIRFPLVCVPGPIAATVNGFVINVQVEPSGELCPDPPLPRVYGVKLPPLPPGQYQVEVSEPPSRSVTGRFVVRNGEPRTFDVQPFAVPVSGGLPIRISGIGPLLVPFCPGGRCTIRVGGVVVQEKRLGADGDIFFDAPPHGPGLVDVTVSHEGRADETVVAALYYFDRFTPGDVSVFERILFPVMFDAPGANGSLWRTEAAMLNATRSFVETYNDIRPKVCDAPMPPCGERLAPGEFTRWSGGTAPWGVSLLVPRNEADELAFSLRVRDVSRVAEGFGTEVPVVREADMFRDTDITLLDVPLDSRYRVKVRAYAFEPFPFAFGTEARVTIVRTNGSRTTLRTELRRICLAIHCAATRLYGEIDLPAGSEGERADVYVSTPEESLSWAFASVTNNSTQQVTVVTPNGRGGAPCAANDACPDEP